MSTQSDGEGLVETFVRGAVFTLGAAAAGLVLRRVFRREPEVIVVAVAEDDLDGNAQHAKLGGNARQAELDGHARQAELDAPGSTTESTR